MIFQRMAKAIRRQDWFQVTIEILIVVIGIFLGLQVTDWNEDRKKSKTEQALVNQMLIEADRAKIEVVNYLADHDRIIHRASDFIAALAKEESCNFTDQELSMGLVAVTSFPPFKLELTVVNELIQSGNTHVLANDDLRLKITEIRSELILLKEQWLRYSATKAHVTETVFPAIGTVFEYNKGFDLDDNSVTGLSFMAPKTLCSDFALIGQLSGALVTHVAYKAYIEQTVAAVSDYQKTVDEYNSKFNHKNGS